MQEAHSKYGVIETCNNVRSCNMTIYTCKNVNEKEQHEGAPYKP
jgi:hypothetical protein